jgi:hypothetical protein
MLFAGVFIADRSYYLWYLFDASWDCELGGAAFKMEIACLGLQAATTVVYAYTTEVSPQFFSRYYLTYGMKTDMIQCYKP